MQMAGVEGLESVLFAREEYRANAVRFPTTKISLLMGKVHVINDENESTTI